jgi:hypothetical protein
MRIHIPALAAAFLALAAPGPAAAYCIHNDLKERTLAAEQDPHPDSRRDKSELKAWIKPGANACCAYKNLDCNPDGKPLSTVDFSMRIEGNPAYVCGVQRGGKPGRVVKIPGDGTVRVQDNPRFEAKAKDAALGTPYVVRISGPDGKDISGPAGLPCRQP